MGREDKAIMGKTNYLFVYDEKCARQLHTLQNKKPNPKKCKRKPPSSNDKSSPLSLEYFVNNKIIDLK